MESGKALLRLFIIAGLTVFTSVLVLFMLRTVSLHQPPPQVEIPGRTAGPFVFATGDVEKGSPYSAAAYRETLNLGDKVIPTLEVRVTLDREWVIFGTGNLNQWTDGEGEIERQNWTDLQKLKWKSDPEAGGLMLLKDFLAQNPLPQLLLQVHNREVAAATSLVKLLGDREEPNLTLIRAENHRLNRELRKQRPQWYFGADAVMLTQWQVFAAVGLEPLASMDFEWLPVGWNNSAPQPPQQIKDELDRRQIGRVLWINTPEQLAEHFSAADRANPNLLGILTNRPKQILELLKVAGEPVTH